MPFYSNTSAVQFKCPSEVKLAIHQNDGYFNAKWLIPIYAIYISYQHVKLATCSKVANSMGMKPEISYHQEDSYSNAKWLIQIYAIQISYQHVELASIFQIVQNEILSSSFSEDVH